MVQPVNINLRPAAEFVYAMARSTASDFVQGLKNVRNLEVIVTRDPTRARENANGRDIVTVDPDQFLRDLIAFGPSVIERGLGLLSSLPGIGPTFADAAPVPVGPSESCAEALDNSKFSCPAREDFCKAANGLPEAPDCKVPQLQNACSAAEFELIVERECGYMATSPTTTGTTPTTTGTTPTTTCTTPTTTGTTPTTTGTTPTTTGAISTRDASGMNPWGIVGIVGGVLAAGATGVGVAACCLKDRILGVRNAGTNEGTPEGGPPPVRISRAATGNRFGYDPSALASYSAFDSDSFPSGVSSLDVSRTASFDEEAPAPASNSDLDSFSSYDSSPAASRNASVVDDTHAPVSDPEPDYLSLCDNEEAVNPTEKLSLEQKKEALEVAGIQTSGMTELDVILEWARYKQEHRNGLWDGASSPATIRKEPVTLTRNQDDGLLYAAASPEDTPRNIMEQAKAFADGKV